VLYSHVIDYGNEVEAGRGKARAIKDGLVKREELFIVSKLWNTFHEKEHVEPIVEGSLRIGVLSTSIFTSCVSVGDPRSPLKIQSPE
jgi:hypothetical protein